MSDWLILETLLSVALFAQLLPSSFVQCLQQSKTLLLCLTFQHQESMPHVKAVIPQMLSHCPGSPSFLLVEWETTSSNAQPGSCISLCSCLLEMVVPEWVQKDGKHQCFISSRSHMVKGKCSVSYWYKSGFEEGTVGRRQSLFCFRVFLL